MESAADSVVIVGAGQAGAWVAITLRDLAPDRRIVLIGDETHPPYERPPLSKAVLAGKAAIESAYIKPADFYAANNIELVLGRTVTGIDRAARFIMFDDGQTLDYGTLVLATGARARPLTIPGADLPQVHTLRNVADADRIRPLLAPGTRVVAIGAGFIGLEFAAVATEAGCAVTVLDAAPQAMGRVIDPSVASAITSGHEGRGVVIRLPVTITAIEPAGDGVEVVLADGERIPADIVIAGIGSIPNTRLADAAGIEVDNGVMVDQFGRTSDPHIFAVGDVTRHYNPLLARSLRLESWQNAQNHGIAIAKVIAGSTEPYAELPWFWSDQYDTNLQIVGVPDQWDRVVWRGEPASGKFTACYMSGDRLVCANTMNNARDIRFLKQLILSGKPVSDAALADPTTSLAALAKG
jgi:3-phenylpropionate/trans-cinnamate dioxygenase ferredoxin reductase subunit